ncbi:hypothetical protein PoMZ_08715 [Pyricularia oryzae]|uniref:Uncharacterized protein n=1 Tax=Pyricularia oryzae TaxID=318829 RepID=A0A4V1C710_PYROR|nr:hypothetical protein PoMZ_08715 [Pyricularia oryzae]
MGMAEELDLMLLCTRRYNNEFLAKRHGTSEEFCTSHDPLIPGPRNQRPIKLVYDFYSGGNPASIIVKQPSLGKIMRRQAAFKNWGSMIEELRIRRQGPHLSAID